MNLICISNNSTGLACANTPSPPGLDNTAKHWCLLIESFKYPDSWTLQLTNLTHQPGSCHPCSLLPASGQFFEVSTGHWGRWLWSKVMANKSDVDSHADIQVWMCPVLTSAALRGRMFVAVANANTLQMVNAKCHLLTHLTFGLVIQESVNIMLILSADDTHGAMSTWGGNADSPRGLQQRKRTGCQLGKKKWANVIGLWGWDKPQIMDGLMADSDGGNT